MHMENNLQKKEKVRNAHKLKISIITPSYNQAEYLEETIDSVLKQNYPALEYIIIDGGSRDHSIEIIKKYQTNISYWISEPDLGQSDALNKAMAKVTGDIVGWINSDDTYEPGTLSKVAKTFLDERINVVMSSKFGFMDEKGLIYGFKKNSYKNHKTLIRYWTTGGMTINQPCVFFRRSLFFDVGGTFDLSLRFAMDYDLWLRMSSITKFHIVKGHWANYRFHNESKSGKGFDNFFPEWLSVSKRYWGKRYSLSWFGHNLSFKAHQIGRKIKNQLLGKA